MKHYLSIIMVTLSGVFLGVSLSTYLLTAGFFNQTLLTGNYSAYVVQSGSMEPALPTGSVVITQSLPRYTVGDIITFGRAGSDQLVTHRIVRKNAEGFITKGDANNDIDPGTVLPEEIVGSARFTVPYLGYLVDFTKTPRGFVVMVVIPATIIIYEELKTISIEIRKSLKKRMRREEAGRASLGIPAIFPVLIVGFLFIAGTTSFFNDTDSVSNNTLGVATDYASSPSPEPTLEPTVENILISEVFFNPKDEEIIDTEGKSEWVELYNAGTSIVNLDGWELGDNNTSEILRDISISPGEYLIISPVSQIEFLTVWGEMPIATPFYSLGTANIGNGLAQNDRMLLLRSVTGDTVDAISWGTDSSQLNPPIPTAAEGSSLERIDPSVDTDNRSDFIEQNSPNPGT